MLPDLSNLGNLTALLSSPLGQIGLGLAMFIFAKRFPAFQSLAWTLLDALKIPRPNVPTPGPTPGPAPSPLPNPSPFPFPIPTPGPNPGPTPDNLRPVVDLLSALLAQLLARRQLNAAAAVVEMARTIETDNANEPEVELK